VVILAPRPTVAGVTVVGHSTKLVMVRLVTTAKSLKRQVTLAVRWVDKARHQQPLVRVDQEALAAVELVLVTVAVVLEVTPVVLEVVVVLVRTTVVPPSPTLRVT
jgi:hypothetical protein